MTNETGPIAVYGASGTVGALVADRLAAGGADLILVGRDRPRLEAVAAALPGRARIDIAAAPIHDRAALTEALAGAAVVVGCAGPFTRVGRAVVDAALAAGADYVDVAGEQGFVRSIYEELESRARRSGRLVVNAMGVEGALGDWVARWAAAAVVGGDAGAGADADADALDLRLGHDRPIDSIVVAHAVEDPAPAPGAQRSLVARLAGPAVTWRARRWDPERPGARRADINFGSLGTRTALGFPTVEALTVPRHVDVGEVQTVLAVGGRWAGAIEAAAPALSLVAGLVSAVAPVVAPVLGPVLEPLAEPLLGPWIDPTRVPDAEARARTRVAVVARARRGFEQATVAVEAADPYALTAVLAAEAALAIAGRSGGPAGVLAPAQVFPAAASLRDLAGRGALVLTTSFET